MSKQKTVIPIVIMAALSVMSQVNAEPGVIGATCRSNAQVYKDGRNMCRNVQGEFYPGILMVVAKKAAIKKCQQLNALDYGDGKCYPQCKTKTHCIYGDNR